MDDLRPPINPYSAPDAPLAHADAAGPPPSASRWRRLGAALLDTAVMFACLLPVVFASETARDTPRDMPFALLTLGLLLALLVVDLWLLARDGQTLGKRWLGIRIVRRDGGRAGLGRTFGIRYLLTSVLGMLPLFSLVDLLFIFGDERRCVHDYMADTIVVDV